MKLMQGKWSLHFRRVWADIFWDPTKNVRDQWNETSCRTSCSKSLWNADSEASSSAETGMVSLNHVCIGKARQLLWRLIKWSWKVIRESYRELSKLFSTKSIRFNMHNKTLMPKFQTRQLNSQSSHLPTHTRSASTSKTNQNNRAVLPL